MHTSVSSSVASTRPVRSLALAALLVGAVTLVSACATGGGGRSTMDQRELQNALSSMQSGVAVWAVAEVRNRDTTWRGASGDARTGTDIRPPSNGKFRIGSITKTFVATVVLQLVHEGRVRLDEPISRYLPTVSAFPQVTVRQLLDHTSGVPDYVASLPFPPSQQFYDNRWRSWTSQQLIEGSLRRPPTFRPPGSRYQYSSTNYVLLGQLIERITGRNYATEIEDRILRPLKLSGTSVPGQSPMIPAPALHGYVMSPKGLLDYTDMNPSVFGASGEMISTTADLDTFVDALLGGRLLPATLLKEMTTPGVRGSSYGLGLKKLTTSCGFDAYGHDGDALAYQSWTFTTADRRRQVSLALAPNFTRDTDKTVDAFVDHALCS